MRLIDDEKVVHEYYKNPSYHQLCKVLNEAPTIDAIPIEWIKKYLHELELISKDNLDLGEDGYFEDVVAIENMLYAWEKENE